MFKTTTMLAVFAIPVIANCDSCDSGNNGGGNNGGGPVVVDCSAYVPQATEAELAATPRDRTDLEQLAIAMEGTFTADQRVYDLLVEDLRRMALDDEHLDINHRAAYAGDRLLLVPDATTLAAISAGTYQGWKCQDEAYAPAVTVQSSYVMLTFDAIVDIPALAAEYQALPGIDAAERDYVVGDGDTVCATEDGSLRYYLFDFGSGDCPSGCIDHDYELYLLDDDGNIDLEHEWSNSSSTPRPAWVETYGC